MLKTYRKDPSSFKPYFPSVCFGGFHQATTIRWNPHRCRVLRAFALRIKALIPGNEKNLEGLRRIRMGPLRLTASFIFTGPIKLNAVHIFGRKTEPCHGPKSYASLKI
ncbi:hypothetical protein I7I53_00552 [Histoplasma capsulatum var. duboisii H88]|uniref:Uncharacterized protein n=1 Tax=Ajellomyces capsulatus (strain H88) TaxID=544711 RepID=A0A8A1LLI6_AJEC8|nr:hypothetical protein I7I53_00552 [Histoplasma capsulatum var. duboisii H88]